MDKVSAGRERRCSLFFAKFYSRKLAALPVDGKTSAQWLKMEEGEGGRILSFFIDRYRTCFGSYYKKIMLSEGTAGVLYPEKGVVGKL